MKNQAAVTLGRLGGKVTSEAKTAAVRENGAKGGRPRSSALELRASEVGLIIERFPNGQYWVSGLENWRSGTWVRNEIARRAAQAESEE